MKNAIVKLALVATLIVSANSAFSASTTKFDGPWPNCVPPVNCVAR